MRNTTKGPQNSGFSQASSLGRAHLHASGMARTIVMGRAAAAQAAGVGEGARPPVGPARRRVELVELSEARGDGRRELLTPIGWKTARTALPRVIGDLPDADFRRMAAIRYAELVEMVGSVPCGGMEPQGARGRPSDGGAVRRVSIAAELRAMRACLEGYALVPVRSGGVRVSIPLRDAVDAVCLRSCEVREVLRQHGWSTRGEWVKRLSAAVLEALAHMSEIRI